MSVLASSSRFILRKTIARLSSAMRAVDAEFERLGAVLQRGVELDAERALEPAAAVEQAGVARLERAIAVIDRGERRRRSGDRARGASALADEQRGLALAAGGDPPRRAGRSALA